MAFDDFLQNQDDKQAQTASPASAAAPAVSAPAAAAPTAPKAPSTASPSGFVSAQQYYNANTGAAQNTANQLSTPVQKQVSDAQSTINNLGKAFGAALQAGTPSDLNGPTQQLATTSTFQPPGGGAGSATQKPAAQTGTSYNAATGRTTTTGPKGYSANGGYDDVDSPKPKAQAPAAPAAPKTTSPTPTQTAASGQVTTAQARARSQELYNGPASVANMPGYAAAQQAVSQGSQQLNALGTQGGRQTLLQNQYGYGSGNAAYDAMLTGQAANNFQALRQQFGLLPQQLSNLVTTSAQQADAAKTADAAKAAAYGAEADAGDQAAADYAKAYQAWLTPTPRANVPNIGDILVQDSNGHWSYQAPPPGYGDDPAYDWMNNIDEGIITAAAGAINPFLGAAYGGFLKGLG